jgi:hypothetical protein
VGLTEFLQPRVPARRMLFVLMRTLFVTVVLGSLASLTLAGCSTPPESPPPDSQPPIHVEPDTTASAEPDSVDPRFVETLLVAAASYREWGRVDERPNLAPVLCRAPTGLDFGFPSHARLSAADDAQHGRKLYYLFAGLQGNRAEELYSGLGTPAAQAIPVGLTIVKQSWAAVPSSRPVANVPAAVPETLDMSSLDAPAPITWVEHDGHRLDVGEQAELFVMAKVGAHDMPGTDAGWIYGTLSADGSRVTSAGLVQQCMDCHDVAPHERLFGLQKTKAFASIKPSPGGGNEALPSSLGLEP